MKKDCTAKCNQQNNANKSVGGEECRIQTAEIIRMHKSVLIQQQACRSNYTQER
jgi:hypothetical protein